MLLVLLIVLLVFALAGGVAVNPLLFILALLLVVAILGDQRGRRIP